MRGSTLVKRELIRRAQVMLGDQFGHDAYHSEGDGPCGGQILRDGCSTIHDEEYPASECSECLCEFCPEVKKLIEDLAAALKQPIRRKKKVHCEKCNHPLKSRLRKTPK